MASTKINRAHDIGVRHAAVMRQQGRLTSDEHDDVLKSIAREKLNNIDMDSYVKLANSGDFDRLRSLAGPDDNEDDRTANERGENAVRHVMQDFVTWSWQKGTIDSKEAIKLLNAVIDLPDGDDDDARLSQHAADSAAIDYRPGPRKGSAPPEISMEEYIKQRTENPGSDEIVDLDADRKR